MSNYYNQKTQLWIKVAFVLDRYGGDERELSSSAITSICSNLFPYSTPCSTAIVHRIKKQIRGEIFEEIKYTQKRKSIKLIDLNVIEEHKDIMDRWEIKRAKLLE